MRALVPRDRPLRSLQTTPSLARPTAWDVAHAGPRVARVAEL